MPNTIQCYKLSRPCQSISSLSAGSQQVSFRGVVTNILSCRLDHKSPKAAKGCLKLLLTDGSGEILVKLWYAETTFDHILLGQAVKTTTVQISPLACPVVSADAVRSLQVNLCANVFPEDDVRCSVEVLLDKEDDSLCLANTLTQRQKDIVSLDELFKHNHDRDPDTSVLALVWDIGTVTTVTTKLNTTFTSLDLAIIDNSSLQASPHALVTPTFLSLAAPLFSSSSTFVPRQTILLIHRPKVLCTPRRRIKLTSQSQVFLNPSLLGTRLLQNWTNRLVPGLSLVSSSVIRRDCQCSVKFSKVLTKQRDGDTYRKQYTLALFLEEISLRQQRQARRAPYWRKFASDLSFVAYVSVLITKFPLVELYQGGQLFCGRCVVCQMNVFDNFPNVHHTCHYPVDTGTQAESSENGKIANIDASGHRLYRTDSTRLQLQWNTNLLSGLSDETGGLALHRQDERHNLYLTEQAIRGLTGLSRNDFESVNHHEKMPSSSDIDSASDPEHDEMLTRLKWIESHVLWARVTLLIGWTDACTDHEGSRVSSCGDEVTSKTSTVAYSSSVGGSSGQEKIVVLNALS